MDEIVSSIPEVSEQPSLEREFLPPSVKNPLIAKQLNTDDEATIQLLTERGLILQTEDGNLIQGTISSGDTDILLTELGDVLTTEFQF